MSPKKGDPVAPPTIGDEWRIRYCTTEAVKGWQDLETRASGNLRQAWETMRGNPGPGPGKPTNRHHQLKGSLAHGTHNGKTLHRWQIEVTGGDRIWYLLDADKHTVWVQYAGAHPKATE
ncbi:hypothetical protein [Saccharothrix syringae]|uniref:Cytotoxic translational repressor of toxin-antitoxin stability system n=1 Tax=Saccharothrix syringae TaxID=103733 RepID=A0A5Q0GW93_SACSY|nr:hypothetical protein [Saccharothrix syringae]QFZ17774.1 hypothetical protein EKG83_10035 [Saccharothrix syringae]